MFTHAITRKPAPNFADGITTSNLGEPSFATMLQQHQTYVQTIQSLGIKVVELEALPDFPDAYFVEDVAVVTPYVAVITNPGAPARNGEQKEMISPLSQFRPIAYITDPGTVDGGDILMVENHFFIGISERTNAEGAKQLGTILAKHGHTVTAVSVADGLHLKSSVNYVGNNTLLLTEEFASGPEFEGYDKIILDNEEAYAGNTLFINNTLLTPQGFPKTKAKLEQLGFPIIELDVSECQKMDGGLTCMSLRF